MIAPFSYWSQIIEEEFKKFIGNSFKLLGLIGVNNTIGKCGSAL
jgi:hypothetical protein